MNGRNVNLCVSSFACIVFALVGKALEAMAPVGAVIAGRVDSSLGPLVIACLAAVDPSTCEDELYT